MSSGIVYDVDAVHQAGLKAIPGKYIERWGSVFSDKFLPLAHLEIKRKYDNTVDEAEAHGIETDVAAEINGFRRSVEYSNNHLISGYQRLAREELLCQEVEQLKGRQQQPEQDSSVTKVEIGGIKVPEGVVLYEEALNTLHIQLAHGGSKRKGSDGKGKLT